MVKKASKVEFTETVMQANFSALLYLLTEQQALIGRLLQALLDNGALTAHQLERVTDINDGEEGLLPTYTQLYNRFASYYLRTKRKLEDDKALDEAFEKAIKRLEDEEDKDDE